MPKSSSYCPYYAKGRCKYGVRCQFSHKEQDSPKTIRKNREVRFQLSLICILCGLGIVENNLWFGITVCGHVACYGCLVKQEKRVNLKNRKNRKLGRPAELLKCKECTNVIEDYYPSGIFLKTEEERVNALKYSDEHWNAISDGYTYKDRRTARCGFVKCSEKLELPDGSLLCAHAHFDPRAVDELKHEKAVERERIERTRRIRYNFKKLIWDLLTILMTSLIFFSYFLYIVWLLSKNETKENSSDFEKMDNYNNINDINKNSNSLMVIYESAVFL
ncbi:unnamed protein product [Caenorhabditis sp. 36 PRJEB53466]|nr:unnamed protein product [Caenorhabditis sp. 36 PRJEB53466]